MRILKSLLITAVTTMSLIAGETYVVNSGPVERPCAGDMPAVFYMSGHTVNQDLNVNVVDLHTDQGPAMHFVVEIYGTQVPTNPEISYSSLFDGDISFTIPGEYVGDQLVLVVFDTNRFIHGGGHQNVTPPTWPAQNMSIEVLQDIPNYPELEIYTKDHHLGNPSIYVLADKIKNVGQTSISNFKVRYFFTTENNSTVVYLADYNSPNCTPSILRVPGTKEYALELDYTGFTLNPGETSEGVNENQFHIWYNDYSPIDKYNDYSNPIPEAVGYLPSSTLFTISNGTAVYSADGTLIAGSENPSKLRSEYVPVQ